MGVMVTEEIGSEVPAEWRSRGVEVIWVVSFGDVTLGVFFTAEEAYGYAEWYEWRLAQENEPAPMPGMS